MLSHQANRRPEVAPPLHRSALRRVRRSVLLLLGHYNFSLHSGIARYAREANWILDDTYVRDGQVPILWRGDGILTLITNPKDVRALRKLPSLPLVDFSKGWLADSMPAQYRDSGSGRPRVYYDNEKIGRLAAQHFLERGFRHIAWFNFGNYWNETERIPTFRDTIEAAGGRYHEIPYYQCFTAHSPPGLGENRHAHRWLIKALRALPKPVGIVVPSDNVAIRLFHACDDAKLNVPEQVAILGCDNDPMICDYAPVPLSSVDSDWESTGYVGARLLDQLMTGKPAPRKTILIPPKGVVTRRSTNVLAVPDPRLARAVRFIWEHYPEPIGTLDVAAAAGLNRRKLERDFQRQFGRSIREEIVDMRIGRARKMLLETELKAHQIAEQCGFGTNIVHFSRTFRRHAGMTISKFRRQYSKSAERP